jgi:methyl-accepting chemotaxis protein/methyl-accepting chemotaxis protein-1 (serine sensor receptor)
MAQRSVKTTLVAAFASIGLVPVAALGWRTWTLAAQFSDGTATAADTATTIQGWVVGIVVGTAVALAWVAVALGRSMTRSILGGVGQLGEGARGVTAAAELLSNASKALSHGASEQMASFEETSACMQDVASLARTDEAHATRATDLMASLTTQANESTAALHALRDSVAAITASSGRVGAMLETIDEIAFVTHLVARNAVLEAERAGDTHTGLTVVANEARSVAQRAAQAARDAASLVAASNADAQASSAKVGEVTHAISSLAETVGHLQRLILDVNESSRQRTKDMDQVADAIAHVERVTARAAGTAAASAAASEHLTAQALATMSVVGELESLSGGSRAYSTRPKTVPIRERRRGGRGPSSSKSRAQHPKDSSSHISRPPLADTGSSGKS